MDSPYQKVEYDMSQYNWNIITEQTVNIYSNIQNSVLKNLIATIHLV